MENVLQKKKTDKGRTTFHCRYKVLYQVLKASKGSYGGN